MSRPLYLLSKKSLVAQSSCQNVQYFIRNDELLFQISQQLHSFCITNAVKLHCAKITTVHMLPSVYISLSKHKIKQLLT